MFETENQSSVDTVSLMTLHGAKGLEFDTVFLPGWEEGVFPSQRSLDEGGLKSLEEERRLAYVGITRARKRAVILHAARRRIYANWQDSMPSRFIDEIPSETVEHSGQAMQERRQLAAQNSIFASGPVTSTRSGYSRPAPRMTDITPDAVQGIAIGSRVFHQKFGYGTVLGVDSDRLHINFEKAGEKRIMAHFVEQVS